MSASARPHFVTIAQGQLRFWYAGRGAPVVVLPGLIRAAKTVCETLATRFQDHSFHVFELPGIGASSVPRPDLNIASVAGSLADAIAAMRLIGAPVVAFDLAAPVAAALPGASRRSMVELDTARSWAANGYNPPDLSLRDDGSHLTALFAHLRNAHVLDPKGNRRAARQGLPLPDPEALNEMVLTAGLEPSRYAALWSVCLSGVAQLGDYSPTPLEGLDQALGPSSGQDHHESMVQPYRSGIWRDYVDISRGRIHLRRAGHGGRPLIALHSAPGSAAPLTPLIQGLGASRSVIAPDFIGNGESSRPDAPVDIARLGQDVVELAKALGLEHYDLWGTHTGALVALEAALQSPARVSRVVLEAPPLLTPEFAADLLANYFPELVPDAWGLYLQQAWNMRRDMFLFWPWYRAERGAARPLAVPDAPFLHDWVMGLLRSGRTYHRSYRAAFEYDSRKHLPRLSAPTMLCAGPADMLADALVTARSLLRDDAVIASTPATVWYPDQGDEAIDQTLLMYQTFLDGSSAS